MKKIVLICLAGIVVVLSLFSCQERQWNAEEVRSALDSLELKFEWLDYRIMQETWELYTTGSSDSLEFYKGLYAYVTSDKNLLPLLRQGKRLLTDEEDKRRLELLMQTVLFSRVEADETITHLRDSLAQFDVNYRAEFEGAPQSSSYLYKIFRTDGNRSRREAAYRAWCSVGGELADGLGKLIRMRNQKARGLGYNNYFRMVFSQQGFDIDEYLTLLKTLDSLSREKYTALLENAKDRLGVEPLEIWDLAYSYVDLSKKVDAYFPADSQMLYVKRSLKGIGFNLDKLPIYFDLSSREGKSQLAYAFPIKPPYDIRVLANLTDGIGSTQVLLHEIGHALHFAHINQERALFVTDFSSCWTEGMAQIIAALCDERQWLKEYPHLPPSLVEQFLIAKQERDIIGLRTTLVRLYFEYEAYQNPNRDLNKLYWDLFEKYMLLPRHEDIKPWAAIIHYTTHPVYLHNYLIADIITAQTMDYLEENYSSIVDNPTIGAFLVQNYYRFGSRYDWRELLERGTGEKLNPTYLLRRLNLVNQ